MNARTPSDTMPSTHAGPSLAARRRSLYWRIHFWAALIASPFTLVAAFTGLLYVFTPQIEGHLYGHLERVAPAGSLQPLDLAVDAARRAVPAGFAVQAVVPPAAPGDTVRVTLAPAPAAPMGEHAGHGAPAARAASPFVAVPGKRTVYVDPYRAQVLGTVLEEERFSEWARRLHSRLLQGEGARWMIELAASWLLVMLLTGVLLWWPHAAAAALPRAGARGRAWWKEWHAFLGVALGVLSLAIVLTGITWSKYAGTQVRALRDWAGQAGPQPPAHLHSMPPGAPQLNYQQAWDRTRALVPDTAGMALQLTPPRGPHGVWRAGLAERPRPASRFDLVMNAYDGRVLYYAGWERQTAFGKATAVGIPFHRGELGIWNQVLLFAFGAGILFSLVSGWVMFFKRRRGHAGWLAGPPRLLPGARRAAPPLAILVGLGLCALLPLLALSALLLAGVEIALARGQRARTAAA